MAVTTIPTAGIANDAVDNTKLDLASNYAFTGTISGTGFNHLITTTISSSVTSVDFNSTYINSSYKTYKIIFRGITLSSNDNLALRIGSSGTLLTTSNHQKGGLAFNFDGTVASISGTSDDKFNFGGHAENTAGSEVQSGEVTMYDLTTSNGNKTIIYMGARVGVNSNRADYKCFINTTSQACDIVSFMVSGSQNMTAGNVSLYGFKS